MGDAYELEKLLRGLSDGSKEPLCRGVGICSNLPGEWEQFFDVDYPFSLFKHWPECGEIAAIPVEGNLCDYVEGDKWSGVYASKRRRLAGWMADLLQLKREAQQ